MVQQYYQNHYEIKRFLLEDSLIKKNTVINTFGGRVAISYRENNIIWAYDELFMCLIKIDLNSEKVEILLTHLQIHKDKILNIRGIIKREDTIILVPLMIDEYWIVYNIKEKNVAYIHPTLLKYQITEICQCGNWIYMIPIKTNDPILIVSLDDMKNFRQIDNWYHLNNKDDAYYFCWGASINGNNAYFPVVETKYICKINSEQVKLLEADISVPIRSISASDDGIWILPIAGNDIYQINQNGNILNRIEILKNEKNFMKQFARIVSTKNYIFLFPFMKNNIYIYIKSKKTSVKLSLNVTLSFGEMVKRIDCSYWDYCIYNEKFYLLPMRYRCTKIDLLTLKVNEIELMCENYYSTDDYLEWHSWRSSFGENWTPIDNGSNAIREYIHFIQYISNSIKPNSEFKIGKQIWKYCKK